MAGDALARRLLAAHDAGDRAALVTLYAEASDQARAAGEVDRAAFYLTHAWVFALESGDPRATDYRERLQQDGRAD